MNTAKCRFCLAAAAAVLLWLGLYPAIASAQTQDNTSVADAARKAREQKKNAGRPVRTLTNDDLPPAPAAEAKPAAAAAPEGQAATGEAKPAEGEATGAEKATAVKPAADQKAEEEKQAQRKAELQAALKRAKADLAESEHELDVLQRLATLDGDAYYGKTDYQNDTQGKAKLDADNQQIGDKKSQVDTLKAKVAELIAELGADAEPGKPAGDEPR